MAMEVSKMDVDTEPMDVSTDVSGKVEAANFKIVSGSYTMEIGSLKNVSVKLLESAEVPNTPQTLDPDDHIDSDSDFKSPVCGPHSNCPCSVHSKPNMSDDENTTDQLITSQSEENCETKQNGIEDNFETQLQNNAEHQGWKTTKDNENDNSCNALISNNTQILKNGVINGVGLYAEDKGPKLYQVKGNIVTPPIITKNLMEIYKFLPIFGKPRNPEELEEFQNEKVREYVGCDLNDEDFNKLAKYCSPNHLRTGNELKMSCRYPSQEPLPEHIVNSLEASDLDDNLRVVKQLKLRLDKDDRHVYIKRLKYRGLKLLPLPQHEDYKISLTAPLEPGKDLVFRVRVYRPFYCSSRDRHNTRHSIFSNDVVLLGRQKLSALRDRLVCPNDVGMRVDVSQNPDEQPPTSAKDLFPSGFLFINNAFYVDAREGCKDHSAPIREWARARCLGDFPRYDMAKVSVGELLVRLGHPEVYVHQGNCEHLFTFSEIRLLSASDPLNLSVYPYHTAISQNQTIYCTTCAEFGAKWIVTGCSRVPFDPAFFCDTCFKLYLYKGGKKICDFKAYSYRGNEINLLKPSS